MSYLAKTPLACPRQVHMCVCVEMVNFGEIQQKHRTCWIIIFLSKFNFSVKNELTF